MWLGAISPLRSSVATPDPAAVVALFRRFHVVAAIVVSVVLASGIVMAWLLLPRIADLWSSSYGLRLCAKLASVATMLAIAAVNRFWLTERALAGVADAKACLSRLLRVDIVAAALAVVLAAGLSFGPPPLASLGTLIAADHYEIALELSPGRAGDNDIEIVLVPMHGGPKEPLSVKLRAGSPASGIEPMTLDATPVSPGRYRIDNVPLWAAGSWQIEIDILVDDFNRVRATTEIALPR
jgi:copper transport protein